MNVGTLVRILNADLSCGTALFNGMPATIAQEPAAVNFKTQHNGARTTITDLLNQLKHQQKDSLVLINGKEVSGVVFHHLTANLIY
jgi:hypothetical protein